MVSINPRHAAALAVLPFLAAGCLDSSGRDTAIAAQSCMLCHNGSTEDDYGGPGLENPHPFPGAAKLQCTTCHGGNPDGTDEDSSHVPPPPEIGDRAFQITNNLAEFNRRTLAGIDKFPDYTVDGVTYTALQYLQFINPGDLRVVTQGKACGQCHEPHADAVSQSLLGTSGGLFSGATYAIGQANMIVAHQGLYEDTAADLGYRAVQSMVATGSPMGVVSQLIEMPVYSSRNGTGPDQIHNNPLYDAGNLPSYVNGDGTVVSDSPLAHLYMEQVSYTCGDCHLGSAGANNRYGDFRSSGCTACHMRYSQSGRSGSQDPNVPKTEPVDVDNIQPGERAHVLQHRIRAVSKTLANGVHVDGIDDYACVDCHQGSNRTVMQYWGIRLDQNQDVRRGNQYPANPVSNTTTRNDTRLFDPVIGNRTFNGRNSNQYLLEEDYDGDGRDDTPADVHYEAGMGCIDCHGSHDLHGADIESGEQPKIVSRMSQAVSIQCQDCHGTIDAYAATVQGTTYAGVAAEVGVDSEGIPLRHVTKESDGYWLTSRLDGARHYIPQTRDTVVDTGAINPVTQQPLYSAKASYAMGRDDGDPSTGTGPRQTNTSHAGFSHTDNMTCASCHGSWTNTCMGCHLGGRYRDDFSNITGERIVYQQANADFVYQSPLFFQLGVNADGKIDTFDSNTKVFYWWRDRNNVQSQVFAFSDRNGAGKDPSRVHPSLSHNAFTAHSIRGRVDSNNEGPRYCVSCHLTSEAIANYGSDYAAFRTAMANRDYASLDWNLLKQHFGQNTNNQMDSPFFAHMVAGLGTGLFLFDDQGRAMNPLDDNANRIGTNGVAPSTFYDPALVDLDLDRIVEPDGTANGSNNHPLLVPGSAAALRNGAADPNLSGPLGVDLIRMLSDPNNGLILDSWIDSDGALGGNAATYIQDP